jgi:hypothetical protein
MSQEEDKKAMMLQRFQKENPGFDFSGTRQSRLNHSGQLVLHFMATYSSNSRQTHCYCLKCVCNRRVVQRLSPRCHTVYGRYASMSLHSDCHCGVPDCRDGDTQTVGVN